MTVICSVPAAGLQYVAHVMAVVHGGADVTHKSTQHIPSATRFSAFAKPTILKHKLWPKVYVVRQFVASIRPTDIEEPLQAKQQMARRS